MKINIKLRDKNEIITEIEPEDYEEMKQGLMNGKIKFLHLENRLIKIDQVISIEPVEGQTIPEKFRLSEPAFEKVDQTKGMENLFNLLKSRGLFKNFADYQKWQNRENKSKVAEN